MSNPDKVLPWWQGKLKERDLMVAFFAKTWNKIGSRIAVMFPDRVRDLYYSAGRLAGLEAQREYFKIGKQKPPGDFKGIVEFIKMALETLKQQGCIKEQVAICNKIDQKPVLLYQ